MGVIMNKQAKLYKAIRKIFTPYLYLRGKYEKYCFDNLTERQIAGTKDKIIDLKNKHAGKRCFIIGAGPSLKIEDLDKLKNEFTFASNRIYRIFNKTKWRPTYYFCQDMTCLREDISEIRNLSFVKFIRPLGRRKYEDKEALYFKIDAVNLKNNLPPCFSGDLSLCVYEGGAVTYSMIQAACYLGFSEIYLLGIDCNYVVANNKVANESYFDKSLYEGKTNGMIPDIQYNFMAYEAARVYCEKNGIIIKNATRGGMLEVFERENFDDIL